LTVAFPGKFLALSSHFTELGYRYFAEAVETGIHPIIARAQAGASQTDE
jgi:hypothetical protein